MTITQRVIDQLYNEQRGGGAICNRKISDFHIHHAIYTRNKKFSKYLDVAENLVALCHKCHSTLHGHLTGWTRRNIFYQDKIAKGYDMRTWNESLKEAGMVTDYFIDTESGGGK